ncbi:MAG: hypothetical protein NZM18_05325 [Thermoflexales bacterium]|nr:hypothetical protein [Thermoflexales bacterium]MDW8351399.1 hypothetical protein [Anaerolineae bacterium]
MEVILRLLIELRLVLIAIVAICCAAFVFTGLSALRELRRAMFRLERSIIVRRAVDAWTKAGLFAVLGLIIWVVTNTSPESVTLSDAAENPLAFTPTVEVNIAEPTPMPTADLAAAMAQITAPAAEAPIADAVNEASPVPTLPPTETPLPSPTPIPPTATPAVSPTPTQLPPQEQLPFIVVVTATPAPVALPTLGPTATPTPLPTPTEAPTATPGDVLVADCPNPGAARIDSPTAGETVSGIYVVRGTANFPGGVGRYRLEILRPNIPGWAFLWENYNAVRDGVLMPRFDATLFPPGIYTLRLSLIDAAGQDTGIYCSVQIRIA